MNELAKESIKNGTVTCFECGKNFGKHVDLYLRDVVWIVDDIWCCWSCSQMILMNEFLRKKNTKENNNE